LLKTISRIFLSKVMEDGCHVDVEAIKTSEEYKNVSDIFFFLTVEFTGFTLD
jgi:hypothetical protein